MSILVKNICIGLFLCLHLNNVLALVEDGGLNGMSFDDAYKKGELLRGQFKNKEALRYLRYAAENGNINANYLYGVELLNNQPTKRSISLAKNYFMKAAKGGHIEAIQVLYNQPNWLSKYEYRAWRQEFYNLAASIERVEPANADLYFYQYYLSVDQSLAKKYLEVATILNQPEALVIKALKVKNGEGFYFFNASRENEAEKLLLAASKQNYIPAIRELINHLKSRKRFDDAFEWRMKLVKLGDLMSLIEVGNILTGITNYNFSRPINKVEGAAYLDLYLKNAGDQKMQSLYSRVQENYDELVNNFSPKEINESKNFELKELNKVNFINVDIYSLKASKIIDLKSSKI